MGLFDKLRGAVSPEPTPQDAVMTILVAAIMADADVDDQEISLLRTICVRSPLFSRNSRDEDDALMRRAVARVSDSRERSLREAAAILPQPLRETAFALACDLVLADGIADRAEQAFIDKLAAVLVIDDRTALAVLEVTAIRNRGP